MKPTLLITGGTGSFGRKFIQYTTIDGILLRILAWGRYAYQFFLPTHPSISSYEGIFGKKIDFLAHPISPPDTKVIILDPVNTRESWAPHGLARSRWILSWPLP